MFQNTAQVKKGNCLLLKQAVRKLGVATKSDMTRLSGLSFATCSNLVNEMVKSGELLVYDEARAGETGRPSSAYWLNADYARILCVFVEALGARPALHCTVCNLNGVLLCDTHEPCDTLDYATLQHSIEALLHANPNIGVIGISVQGIVAPDGMVLQCDTPLLAGMRLGKLLSVRFALPVVCENDMNLLAYGMIQAPPPPQSNSVAVLAQYRAVPPGAGLVVDGHILRGSTNFAGEISHLPLRGLSECEQIARQLICIAVVANPAVVAIVGDVITHAMLPDVEAMVQAQIPPPHCPALLLLKNSFACAQKGLAALCLNGFDHEAF